VLVRLLHRLAGEFARGAGVKDRQAMRASDTR